MHIINFFLDHVREFRYDPESYNHLLESYCRSGLFDASKSGRLNIVQLMIEHYKPSGEDLTYAFEMACSKCSWDVIFYFKETFGLSQSRALEIACQGKHRKLVDWLIENGDDDWEHGLMGACVSGDVSLIQLMLDRGASENITRGFEAACMSGNLDASKYLLESGKIKTIGKRLGYIHSMQVKKLLIDYDDARIIRVFPANVCCLLNEGVSLDILLQYERPEATARIARLAEDSLRVVHSSLQGTLCSDLVSALKMFIGYDVNAQVVESIGCYSSS